MEMQVSIALPLTSLSMTFYPLVDTLICNAKYGL